VGFVRIASTHAVRLMAVVGDAGFHG